ncbi:MAG: PucR family transcriptional regulator [Spirochaetes bacterium]|nr:PucR family transcriptional regulator [Spirochaetota bacterium]MBU1078910.1 PucR family transcriptional regulator [Spirochaetota bacterium]
MSPGAPEPGPPTVADLLLLPALSGAAVLAGCLGTGRALSWLARLGSPEDALSIGSGDLIMATGEAALARGGPRFIARLTERGVSGIALPWTAEDRASLDALSRDADESGLPLAMLPRDVGYRELSLAVASLRFDSRAPGAGPRGAAPDGAIGLLAAMSRGDGAALNRVCLGGELRRERDWPEIRAAVEAYLRHSGNAIATAGELGVHRHTVRARIRRYESISGLSLDDPDSRLAVSLAFRLSAEGACPSDGPS